MLAQMEIGWGHWVGFNVCVLVFLGLDLGFFHRHARVVRFKEALGWTALWFVLALAFSGLVGSMRGRREALDFINGYILELSLSMDNVFVIALIFGYFRVPLQYQHRVLFWGIIGALIMRGLMIYGGAKLVLMFHWVLYLMGLFLLVTGIKLIFSTEEEIEPEKNPLIRLARKFFPVSPHFDADRFVTLWDGRWALTPLALVLIMVETTDLVFAVDSIPAIFGITLDPFIVYTSNVFAILGLRSLFFVLAGAIGCFHYLKIGLALVLVFIGCKMLLEGVQVKIESEWSLGIVVAIICGSILISITRTRRSNV